MRYICLLPIICILFLTACNDQEHPNKVYASGEKPAASKLPVSSKLDNTGTTMIINLVSKYYGLKNALVATKAAEADSAALKLDVMAGLFLTYLESDSVHRPVLKPYLDTIKNQSELIFAIHDETCEKQRLAFGLISSAFYGLVRQADLKHAGIYHQYCPMAFNEKGASWLSEEAEIKNPYFGKKMMECGEILDSL